MILQIEVNGKNAAPLYKFLKAKKSGVLVDEIKWNFAKFLVDRQGIVVERYAPVTSPLQIEVCFHTFFKYFNGGILVKSSMFLCFESHQSIVFPLRLNLLQRDIQNLLGSS